MNFLDRSIAWWNPRAGAVRAHARAVTAVLEDRVRSYEGASQTRRLAGWNTSGGSQNAEAAGGGGLTVLRNRCRALTRDNEWGTSALASLKANIIGTGIRPKFLDAEGKKDAALTLAWEEWGETTACDADGRHDFYGLEDLVAGEVVEAGECLVRRRLRRTADGIPFNFQLQVLEPDHLDTLRDGMVDRFGNRLVQGVEFNAFGQRVAYWLFPEHPGENTAFGRASLQSVRVPADQMLHVFRCDRGGQVRGIPWGAPAIVKMRGLDEYQDARLVREKIAACFVGFIEDLVGDAGGVPNIGIPSSTESGDPGSKTAKFEPGLWQPVEAGKKIHFGNPPVVEGYREFVTLHLRGVAAAYGTTYEELTGDMTQVNFSSGRMGRLAYHRRLDRWQSLMLKPQLLMPVAGWFREMAAMAGVGSARTRGHGVRWTMPRREMIDPTKEVPARTLAIQAGQTSLQEVIRQDGRDPDVVMAEIREDLDRAADLDLRLTSLHGAAAEEPAAPPDPDDEEGTEDPDDDTEGSNGRARLLLSARP